MSLGMRKIFTQTAPEDLAREGATVDWCRAGRKGVHAKFDNGWVVSIQWGSGTYSDNHDDLSGEWDDPAKDSTTAEVAVWKGDGGFCRWADGDSVQGWLTWDQVQALLDLAAADAVPDPVSVKSAPLATEGKPDA